jgi:hypothetical protein
LDEQARSRDAIIDDKDRFPFPLMWYTAVIFLVAAADWILISL